MTGKALTQSQILARIHNDPKGNPTMVAALLAAKEKAAK